MYQPLRLYQTLTEAGLHTTHSVAVTQPHEGLWREAVLLCTICCVFVLHRCVFFTLPLNVATVNWYTLLPSKAWWYWLYYLVHWNHTNTFTLMLCLSALVNSQSCVLQWYFYMKHANSTVNRPRSLISKESAVRWDRVMHNGPPGFVAKVQWKRTFNVSTCIPASKYLNNVKKCQMMVAALSQNYHHTRILFDFGQICIFQSLILILNTHFNAQSNIHFTPVSQLRRTERNMNA